MKPTLFLLSSFLILVLSFSVSYAKQTGKQDSTKANSKPAVEKSIADTGMAAKPDTSKARIPTLKSKLGINPKSNLGLKMKEPSRNAESANSTVDSAMIVKPDTTKAKIKTSRPDTTVDKKMQKKPGE